MASMAPNPSRDLPLCWEQHSKLLPGVDKICGDDVAQWKVDDVANFIKTLPGCVDLSKVFRDEVSQLVKRKKGYLGFYTL